MYIKVIKAIIRFKAVIKSSINLKSIYIIKLQIVKVAMF
jgi:uncharacterized membrane protein